MGPSIEIQCQSCGLFRSMAEMFYCTNCKKIICKSATCTCEDVDILYCPSCFELTFQGDAIKNLYRCIKCYDCPLCKTTLQKKQNTIPDQDPTFYLECPYCLWNSTSIGIEAKSVQELCDLCKQFDLNDTVKNEFNMHVSEMKKQFPEKNSKASNRLKYMAVRTPTGGDQSLKIGEWNKQLLEEQLEEKEKRIVDRVGDEDINTHLERVIGEAENEDQKKMLLPRENIELSNRFPYYTTKDHVIPTRVPLRAKKSRKCLTCVNKGENSLFLLKPQMNPLTGDSLNQATTDDWYRVQSFAMLYFPILSIIQPLPTIAEQPLTLRIMNPCNISGSLINGDIELTISQSKTTDTNCNVLLPSESLIIPGEDLATWNAPTDVVNPSYIKEKGANYIILNILIEKNDDVPALFYIQCDCKMKVNEDTISNSQIYRIHL
ncbi:hypothetical protein WA158_006214 [Blastocystis sp. Blastoise]